MYTKELDDGCCQDGRLSWSICDPDGTHICYVDDEDSADVLLSHLNR